MQQLPYLNPRRVDVILDFVETFLDVAKKLKNPSTETSCSAKLNVKFRNLEIK